jgi:hypothetical protein
LVDKEKWIGKVVEEIGHGPVLGYYCEIRTEHLWNASHRWYHLSHLGS